MGLNCVNIRDTSTLKTKTKIPFFSKSLVKMLSWNLNFCKTNAFKRGHSWS